MSANGAASNPASGDGRTIGLRDASSAFARSGALPDSAEMDVLRNCLSAVMLEHHEQSKKFATVAADHARQSKENAVLTAQNLQLSRDVATLAGERDALATARADAVALCAAAEAERDELRSKCSKLDEHLSDIESSTSWVATRRLREVFDRHPRLRRLATTIQRALARP
jgi:chromosome segregation ATPase